MCRNIKNLHNFSPPASKDEIRASALQYVKKISGSSKPSRINEAFFYLAVEKIAQASEELLASLSAHSPPRNRETEAAKARARSLKRFGISESK